MTMLTEEGVFQWVILACKKKFNRNSFQAAILKEIQEIMF